MKTSAGEVGAMTCPTVIDIDPIRAVPDGIKDMEGDQPQIDWHREVRKQQDRRYLHLQLQAQGCHVDQLIGITPLGRMIGSRTMRTCGLCRPASSPLKD
jgi:hypothetical protein